VGEAEKEDNVTNRLYGDWQNLSKLGPQQFQCGFCDANVASRDGYFFQGAQARQIFICPNCNRPTFFDGDRQIPGVAPGRPIAKLPDGVASIYKEARQSISVESYTAAVLALRKVLMHIGVAEGAAENLSFVAYVQYLDSKGFIPPRGKGWVDHIRNKGNEANHEIVIMSKEDAERLCTFTEMLLRFIYEFPGLVP
jgi:hypothetical protein